MKTILFVLIFSIPAYAESYKFGENGTIIRLSDHAFIPADDGNRDYAIYRAWAKAGNVTEAADPIVPKGKTDLELLKEQVDSIKKDVDDLKAVGK